MGANFQIGLFEVLSFQFKRLLYPIGHRGRVKKTFLKKVKLAYKLMHKCSRSVYLCTLMQKLKPRKHIVSLKMEKYFYFYVLLGHSRQQNKFVLQFVSICISYNIPAVARRAPSSK